LDIAEAYLWHEGRRAGLGEEFLSSVTKVEESLATWFPLSRQVNSGDHFGGNGRFPTKRCLPRFDRAQAARQVKAREKTPIGHSPLQQLLSRAHRFRGRQIEGGDPIRMLKLRRMNQGVAHVEQLLPSRRNQHGGMPGCVARRGKHQYARRDFRRPI
jgi:hypothetical protein